MSLNFRRGEIRIQAFVLRQSILQFLQIIALEKQAFRPVGAEYIARHRRAECTAAAAAKLKPTAGRTLFIVLFQLLHRRTYVFDVGSILQKLLQAVRFHAAEEPPVLYVVPGQLMAGVKVPVCSDS